MDTINTVWCFLCLLASLGVGNVVAQNNSQLVDYYIDLINDNVNRCMNYVVPKNSNVFRPDNTRPANFGSNFDFIVIGSGSGGSVMASRLSENNKWRVLLLEAGEMENNFTDIPSMYFYLAKSPYNWGYDSVSQKYACLGMKNRKCPYPRGRGLGGTTIINGLVYNRGSILDYQEWTDLGNRRWNYLDVLPYFKKSENATMIFNGDPQYRGYRGPLHVEYNNIKSPQLEAFFLANLELGRSIVDYNGEQQLGVSPTQMNKIHGSRMSAARAYIRPIIDTRRNLIISTGSYVIEILTNGTGDNLKAYGVKFTKNKRTYIALARKEIILSAGAIASPQILLLSGIGPQKELESHEIEVKTNLPVGHNLQDHTTFYGINVRTNYTEPIRSLREYVLDYLDGKGPLSVPGNNQGLGFFQTHYPNKKGVPDIEIMMIPANRSNPVYQEYMQYTDTTYNAINKEIDDTRTFIPYVILLQPKSIGTVRLKSADPYAHPLIDPQFLRHPEDLERLMDGVRIVRRMMTTRAFLAMNATFAIARLPACKSFTYMSDAYMRCYIRQTTMNIYHPVGTCRMAPKNRAGVVDSEFRVYGVGNLRVVDGSALPFSLRSHPSAPIMMMAERAADFIKHEYE